MSGIINSAGSKSGVIGVYPKVSASGGTETDYNGFRVHKFLSGSTTFTVSVGGRVDVLIVAGGGGGSNSGGQGGTYGYAAGGGGGYIFNPNFLVQPGSYTVVVGATAAVATKGNTSSVFGISAEGGGKGGDSSHTSANCNGGSGGGTHATSGNTKIGGAGSQGHKGGNGKFVTGSWDTGSGGGGAGGPGINGQGTSEMAGGPGLRLGDSAAYAVDSAWAVTWYAGGGNGGSAVTTDNNITGNPADYSTYGTREINRGRTANLTNGAANTGAGGGGNSQGGSGIVIIRYIL